MPEKYPEHQKLQAIREKSQEIGSFIEWLRDSKKFVFAQWMDDKLVPQPLHIEETLAEYFEIDLKKLEQEKRAMLEEFRQQNSKST